MFSGREQNISILTILHFLGIVGIVSVRSKSLSASLKKMKLTDIGLQLVWINFESTIRENSKSVKSVKINPQKTKK